MRAVWRKAVADLFGRGWQSVLILVTIMASAALIYVGLATLQGTSSAYDRQMEAAQGTHVNFWMEGADAASVAEQIGRMPGVAGMSDLRQIYLAQLAGLVKDGHKGISVTAPGSESPSLSRVTLLEGRELEADELDAALLDYSMARFYGIRVGDRVHLETPSGTAELRVVGLHTDALTCPFPTCSPRSLYVTKKAFAALTRGIDKQVTYFGVRLAEPEQADQFQALVTKQFKETKIQAWNWLMIRQVMQLVQGPTVAFLMVAGLMAVIAAGLITANIIGGAVVIQFREIGVLKALGFTRGQVLALFVSQNGLLGVVGSVAGIAAGQLLASRKLAVYAQSMGVPEIQRFQPTLALWILAGMVLTAAIFALLPAWRAGRLAPAAVLSDGFSPPRARLPLIVRFLSALRFPTTVLLGVKDITARRGRLAMTVLTLSFSLVILLVSTGFTQLVERFEADPEWLGINYDIAVSSPELPIGEAEAAVREDGRTAQYYKAEYAAASAPDHAATFGLRALDGDWQRFPYSILPGGRMVQGPGELVLGAGAARQMGVNVGDRFPVQIAGKTQELTLVGLSREMNNLGRMGYITLETLRGFDPTAEPHSLLLKAKDGADPVAMKDALSGRLGYPHRVALADRTIPPEVLEITGLGKSLSLLIALIAALSVLNTALLNAKEQMREVGIRKAIGMTPLQILLAAAAGGAWIGVVASLLGVPAGVGVDRLVIAALSRPLGEGVFTGGGFTPWILAVTAVGGILLAVVAALPAALWAGRLTTTEVLRAE